MASSGTSDRSRAAMIATAERLVAEKGVGAVSMRMVGEAAGQRNHSAVQFHFGTWEGLLQAIAAERMGPISRHRQAMLERLDREGRGTDVRGLVEALVLPLATATLGEPRGCYARFLAVSYADPQWSAAVRFTVQGAAFQSWRARLEAALQHVPVRLRTVRVDHAVSTVITAVARWEGGRGRAGIGERALIADLIDTTVAFLVAPSSMRRTQRTRPAARAS